MAYPPRLLTNAEHTEMKLSITSKLIALMALTTLVWHQNIAAQEVVSEDEQELKNEVTNAADVICKAFSPDIDDQGKPQTTKRGGFFSKLWRDVKGVVVGTAVKNALLSLGKRDYETRRNPFSADKDTHQASKRGGFFSDLWNDVKGNVIGTAVKNALAGLGKRERGIWRNENDDGQKWNNYWRKNFTDVKEKSRDLNNNEIPSSSCDPDYLIQFVKLEQALEVLGSLTNLVLTFKQCNETSGN